MDIFYSPKVMEGIYNIQNLCPVLRTYISGSALEANDNSSQPQENPGRFTLFDDEDQQPDKDPELGGSASGLRPQSPSNTLRFES